MARIYIKCPYCKGCGGYRVFPEGDKTSKWIRCIMCNSGRILWSSDYNVVE